MNNTEYSDNQEWLPWTAEDKADLIQTPSYDQEPPFVMDYDYNRNRKKTDNTPFP